VVYSLNSGNAAPADKTIVLKAHAYVSSSTANVARPV
jgi:hypothetical protein